MITGLGAGGAEAVLYRLATSSTDFEHEVISLEERAWYSDKLETHGIRVHHIGWKAVGSLRAAFRLHRLIRAADADVVQSWMYRPNFFAGVSSRLLGKTVVWNIRCSTFDVYPLATRVLARAGGYLARWIPRKIINCSAESRQLHARIGYDFCEVVVIPNGYEHNQFRPNEEARQTTRAKLGIAPDTFLIGSIARWHVQKGHSVLLRALSILRDRGVPFRMLLVGNGIDASNTNVTKLVAEHDCADLVLLAGERSDVPEIASAIDLHVLASVGGEGFPNIVAETMLSGTPNVVTEVGDSAKIVGSSGWTVPPRDPERLADAIAEAYSEWSGAPDRWRRRKEEGRRHIIEDFTLERMVEAYEKVWAEVARNG